ncbi:MAG TPA: ATP-binding cassette domain-containing protein, partial [Acidimicrobiales bacterium]
MSSHLATLIIRGLSVAAGPHPLLADVDLIVASGDRLGLVGPNGSGKSTLLQTLGGLRSPEDGHVRLAPPSATVGYLPQEARPQPGETVRGLLTRRTGVADAGARLDATTRALASGEPGADESYAAALDRWLALGGADIDARAGAVTAGLGLPARLLDRATAHLSGGQAARVQLAALLLARFDVFLLDEPTNDLDLGGLDRLERFVLGLTSPLVVVSHDRAFLERTVTAVAEIDDHAHTLTRYDGGWTAYLDEHARTRHHAEQDYRTYVDQRDTLVERARTQRRWAAMGARTARRSGETDKFIRHRALQSSESMACHARRTEKALARIAVVDKPWEGWDLRLSIADAGRSGDLVAQLDGAVVTLVSEEGGKGFVLGPASLDIGWGDRMAITGANGSGKTTLLQALLGRVPLAAGRSYLGPGVVTGEIGQGRNEFDG